MDKSPIKWNQKAVGKVGEYAAAGGLIGMMPGLHDPVAAAAGIGIGAAIGAGAGVAAAYRAKRREHMQDGVNEARK